MQILLVAFTWHATIISYQWSQIGGVPLERHQPPFLNAINEIFPTSAHALMVVQHGEAQQRTADVVNPTCACVPQAVRGDLEQHGASTGPWLGRQGPL
jgi:hypothetical protein